MSNLPRRELLTVFAAALGLSACARPVDMLGNAASAIGDAANDITDPAIAQVPGFQRPDAAFKLTATVKGVIVGGMSQLNAVDEVKTGIYRPGDKRDENVYYVNDKRRVLGWLTYDDMGGSGARDFAKEVSDAVIGGPGTVKTRSFSRKRIVDARQITYTEYLRYDGVVDVDAGGQSVKALKLTRIEINPNRGDYYGEVGYFRALQVGTDANGQPQYIGSGLIKTDRMAGGSVANPIQDIIPMSIVDNGVRTASGPASVQTAGTAQALVPSTLPQRALLQGTAIPNAANVQEAAADLQAAYFYQSKCPMPRPAQAVGGGYCGL